VLSLVSGREVIMTEYRLFRLDATSRIMGPAIELDLPDDDAAIAKAVEIDHAHTIEIWSRARLVSRVNPTR